MAYNFIKPQNTNAKVWRYMDIEKYIRMLQTNSLYFARLFQLEDPYEGSYIPAKILKPGFQHFEVTDNTKEFEKNTNDECNREMAVNCWHLNEDESMAMWKLYASGGKGIAIQSTFARLEQAISDSPIKGINVGVVKYLNYTTEEFRNDTSLSLFDGVMHKQKAYEYEQEIRAVIFTRPLNISCDTGIPVEIKLTLLIEKIYVSPFVNSEFIELIRHENRKYSLNAEVVPSQLLRKPEY